MKKFFKISLIVVLTLAIAFTVFAVTTTNSEMAAGNVCPNAGWHSWNSCTFGALPGLQGLVRSDIDAGWHS